VTVESLAYAHVISLDPNDEGTVTVGEHCRIHRTVQLDVDGFGYQLRPDGTWETKPQRYGVRISEDVHIGAGTVIARGSYRNTRIRRGTRIDAKVFIAHNVRIGEDCLIVAGAILCGSVELGDRVIVGPGAIVKEHVTVADDALIGAGAVVLKDVPQNAVMVGNPAKYLRDRKPQEAV